jgi:hypothetical protein
LIRSVLSGVQGTRKQQIRQSGGIMKMGMNPIGHGRTNALDRFEVLKSGGCDGAR